MKQKKRADKQLARVKKWESLSTDKRSNKNYSGDRKPGRSSCKKEN